VQRAAGHLLRNGLAIAIASLAGTPATAQVSQMEQLAVACPLDAEHIQPLALGREVLGSRACFGCHLQGTGAFATLDPEVTKIVGAEFLQRAVHDNWVLGNEWSTWSARDRHAQAYTTLLGERSKRMGKILGVEQIERDARCLACHSSLPAASVKREGMVVDAAYFAADRVDERVALGVNCEACHGAAGAHRPEDRAGWIDVHVASQTWRFKSPVEKQSDFGFYDVRTPSSRMRMCLSCHLGDAVQGRLVTHAMYAAGHPPLPSFELKSFADMMPPHWRDLGGADTQEPMGASPQTLTGKKPKRITAEFLAKTSDAYFANLRENHKDFYASITENFDAFAVGTRAVAVGALVAWRKNADLTRALMSERELPLLERENRWPELAQFECSACHHELREGDWREERKAEFAPGRPLLRDWSAPLVRAVLRALAPDHVLAFDEHRRSIAMAAAAEPFGDRAGLDKSLSDATRRMDELVAEIESRPFTREDALAMLRSIAAVGGEAMLDYDAARQLTWALGEVLDEVDPDKRWAAPRERYALLAERFVLDLATVNVRKESPFDVPGAGGRVAYEIELSTLLPAMGKHSAGEVREAFRAVGQAVTNDPP
jgi:hypothetical protein